MATMAADLLEQARAGDEEAFGRLVEGHRRELQVHCYRILGSTQDAEDALQETLLAAWQGLGGFEGRASLRTWLYRIATSRCLNAVRAAKRRPARAPTVPAQLSIEPPEPTRLGRGDLAGAVPRRPPRRPAATASPVPRNATTPGRPYRWPS